MVAGACGPAPPGETPLPPVEAPKDPIKMDISMRLDVYQHVSKDIDQIESIVKGSKPLAFADFLVQTAYAGDLDPAVEQAATRRRDRHGDIASWEAQGLVGENSSGLLTVRGAVDGAVVEAENQDRSVIYQALAAKNGTSVEEIQKVYAERLRKDAPNGTPVQNPDGSWAVKS
jgi:uncharacterized protein YdbL (DUF1318 family)